MLGNENKYRSWIPHGFDFLNEQEARKQLELKANFRKLFEEAEYREIIPPTFDYGATFDITTRNATRNSSFGVRDHDGENLAVRSDLTVQVIKAAANGRLGNNFPQRLSYIQPIFQDHASGSGTMREITQAGVELLGGQSSEGFQEILTLARRCFEKLGLEPRILYGDVRFLNILFKNVPQNSLSQMSAAFHNKDVSQIKQICRDVGLSEPVSRILEEVPLIFGGSDALEKLMELCRDVPELLSILKEAEKQEGVIYDFSLVRELSYYTGPVIEAYVPGSTERLLSGGVYDDLFSRFSSNSECACGFAINLSGLVGM